uniref:Uncharacterized protein n=1 Tax=Tetranychus urticae TaxID=32264 RepID=T1K0B1_TETUR
MHVMTSGSHVLFEKSMENDSIFDADAITLAEVMLSRNMVVNPLDDMTTGFER